MVTSRKGAQIGWKRQTWSLSERTWSSLGSSWRMDIRWGVHKWATKNTLVVTFHYTGCLIGIIISWFIIIPKNWVVWSPIYPKQPRSFFHWSSDYGLIMTYLLFLPPIALWFSGYRGLGGLGRQESAKYPNYFGGKSPSHTRNPREGHHQLY